MLNDGYLGSGSILARSIKKHGRKNHTREILEFLESRELLLEREKELLDAEKLKDPMCMNLMEGGLGGALPGEQNSFFGKHHTPETIKKISDSMKGEKGPCFGRVGELHPMFGTQHSPEVRERIREKLLGRPLSEHHVSQIKKGHEKHNAPIRERNEKINALLQEGKTRKEAAEIMNVPINIVYVAINRSKRNANLGK